MIGKKYKDVYLQTATMVDWAMCRIEKNSTPEDIADLVADEVEIT